MSKKPNSTMRPVRNVDLVEARQAIPFTERLELEVIEAIAVEEGTGPKRYRAKVGQCDSMNQNRRVYPKAEWMMNIHRAMTQMIPKGMLMGSVDHATWGGNLRDTAILWKSLECNDATGSVVGEFEIIEGHSRGRDLKCQIDAGMAIGFSTSGYAQARYPTDAERAQYSIPESEEDAVIIQNWDLRKIDAVDEPSVADARLGNESVADGGTVEKPMKTLAELKEQNPELFAAHEAAIAEALAAAKAQSDKALADLTAAVEAAKADVQAKADEATGLTTQVTDLTAKLEEATAKIEAAQAEAKAQAEAAAELKRVADVSAKAAELLKDSRFARPLQKAVESAIADKAFDVAALESLVKAKTAEYEAVAESMKAQAPEQFVITGVTSVNNSGNNDEFEALPVAEELAKAL